jgi:tetratricopeptide (TPR) repeat protein
MKSTKFLLLVTTWMLLNSCTDKKTSPETQNIYLTPSVMCGTVQFTDGCGPASDTLIRFGLALLHHMTYEDARYTFEQLIEKDPDCFWGYWGKAMSYIHPLWPDMPTEQEMESGLLLSQRGMSLAKNQKEKLYGSALAAYYEPGDKTKAERMALLQKGLAEATELMPEDVEVALFNGLFRLGLVSPADKTFAVQREVGEMAENYLIKYPDHPGGFHYAIHAYDVPPLADRALVVARNYGKIAPEIPHALHMPSHIFTRLGYWQESIDWNTRAAIAASNLPYEGSVSPHLFHALDYKVYSLLQLAQDDKAREALKNIDTLRAPLNEGVATAYALAAIPARIPLENQLWEDAADIALPDTTRFPWDKFPQWEALIHFGKGIGGARSGKTEIVDQSLSRLIALQTILGNTPQTKYWYEQMSAQIMSIKAWQALGQGRKDEGLTLMKQAADLEDATQKNPVSPGELLPAREMLGDMLLEMKNPKEALLAFEKCLESRPNRFNSLYGAGLAAKNSGDMEKAKNYFTKVIELEGPTPSSRERAKQARKLLSEG